MKLVIKRDQKQEKGFFGGDKGMKFLLTARAELTQEERNLVAKYKAENERLTTVTVEGGQPRLLWIKDLVAGQTFECKDVLSLLKAEGEIKQACQSFKALLDVMASFGGEEAIEI